MLAIDWTQSNREHPAKLLTTHHSLELNLLSQSILHNVRLEISLYIYNSLVSGAFVNFIQPFIA